MKYLTVNDLWNIRYLAQNILKTHPYLEKTEAVTQAAKQIMKKNERKHL